MHWSILNNLHFKLIAAYLIIYNHDVAANRNMFSEGAEQFVGVDVSADVFGEDNHDIYPVAYHDVNSDKLTDIIAVSRERTSINIFLAMDEIPYLRRAFRSNNITLNYGRKKIMSVRPGDFTGNGMADLMVTLGEDDYQQHANKTGITVDVLFCSIYLGKQRYQILSLECGGPGNGGMIRNLTQEPTVLDLNGDMALDLIGEVWIASTESVKNMTSWRKQRQIWISERTTDSFEWKSDHEFHVPDSSTNETIRDMTHISSNAYADIDGDSIPELMILTEFQDANMSQYGKTIYFLETFEIVKDSNKDTAFKFKYPPEVLNILPQKDETQVIGQPMIMDFQHNGKLEHLVPYCSTLKCDTTFGIYVMDQANALPLPLRSLTYEGLQWTFIPPSKPPKFSENGTRIAFKMEDFYSRALSLRVGDYNLDGYPDLLGVLKTRGSGNDRMTRAVLFENVPCIPAPENPCHYNRTFSANFDIFKNYKNVISASFYDISDNGALDVILVTMHTKQQASQNQRFVIQAFQNEMNFDASFLKVMVLTGQQCVACDRGIPYGNVLPGATIKYSSLNNKGIEESGVMVQTYRTSHMPLDLPCNVFGIGHSPNFIEKLEVTIAPNNEEVYSREWKQIIPNSQIVVVPNPLEKPNRWTMKLFLTPSDVVLKTFGILVGVCLVLATLVAGLEFKERREDRLARQSEMHRLVLWLS